MKITDEMLYQVAEEAEAHWLAFVLPGDKTVDFSPSNAFLHKMEHLCRRASRRAKAKQALLLFRKAAAVLLIALGLAFSGMMTVEAFRWEVLNLMTEIYEQYTVFRVSPLDSSNKGYYYKTLPDIHMYYLPEEAVHQAGHGDSTSMRITYQGYEPDAPFVTLQVHLFRPASNHSVVFSTDHTEVRHFWLNGVDITAYTSGEITTLRWFQENLYFELYGNLAVEELLTVAENIEIVP